MKSPAFRHLWIFSLGVLAWQGCKGSPDPTLQEILILPDAVQRGEEAFSPNPVTIPVGGTVIWINRDRVAHSVKGGTEAGPCAFASEEIRPGGEYSRRFDHPVVCRYVCPIHGRAMSGRLVITPAE